MSNSTSNAEELLSFGSVKKRHSAGDAVDRSTKSKSLFLERYKKYLGICCFLFTLVLCLRYEISFVHLIIIIMFLFDWVTIFTGIQLYRVPIQIHIVFLVAHPFGAVVTSTALNGRELYTARKSRRVGRKLEKTGVLFSPSLQIIT